MAHYFAQIKSGTHHRSKICRALTTMASSNQPFANTNINSPPHRTRPTQGELVEEIMAAADTRHPLIDIAINLTDHSFDKDRDQILARAHRTGIEALIITGCCLRTTEAAQHLIDSTITSSPLPLFFTAGVHPHNAKQCDEQTLAALRAFASHPRCVAIGECGLDFNRNFSPPDVQEEWFGRQIELAEELQKPLLLHCRDAGDRFDALLRKHRRSVGGVLHCFTGTAAEATAALNNNLHIGITGWICDERPERGAAALAAVLPLIPDDRLLLETDAPYLVPRSITPSKKRPSRNEPALLPIVLRAVAAARGQSVEDVAAISTANAKRLFNLFN